MRARSLIATSAIIGGLFIYGASGLLHRRRSDLDRACFTLHQMEPAPAAAIRLTPSAQPNQLFICGKLCAVKR